MATQITWTIDSMETKLQDGNYQNVVITANWRCSGVDGVYYASNYGSCQLPPPGPNFIPYDQLTLQEVLNMIWANGVNKDQVEAQVAAEVENLVNPPVVQLPLPW